MSQIRKGLAGFEDIQFDTDGIGLKYDRMVSTGLLQEFSAINATMIPLLLATRNLPMYDGSTLTATEVDTAIAQLAGSLMGIYKFPNQDVLDDIISAGSGVIISTDERDKLTQITDVGSGKIITVAEREKLETLRNITAEDLESLENIKKASPVGSYLDHSVETEPEGYLLCDGRSLVRETYSELFGVIGTRFGSVDANTFNLPDWQGMFQRFWDNGRGVDLDAANRTDRGDGVLGDFVGTGQAEDVGPHDHPVTGNWSSDNTGAFQGNLSSGGSSALYTSNGVGISDGIQNVPVNMTSARMIRAFSV